MYRQNKEDECDTCILDICTEYGKDVQRSNVRMCIDWKGD